MKRKMKFNDESNGGAGHVSEAPPTARASNGKTRILIVEDEPAMVPGPAETTSSTKVMK